MGTPFVMLRVCVRPNEPTSFLPCQRLKRLQSRDVQPRSSPQVCSPTWGEKDADATCQTKGCILGAFMAIELNYWVALKQSQFSDAFSRPSATGTTLSAPLSRRVSVFSPLSALLSPFFPASFLLCASIRPRPCAFRLRFTPSHVVFFLPYFACILCAVFGVEF